MYLESPLEDAFVTAYIILDWLRQIAIEASESFVNIYQEMKLFVKAKKHQKEIREGTRLCAQLLGSAYRAIAECQTSSMRIGYPVCAT